MAETKDRYIETIGRRKTAAARVRITPAKKTSVIINDKDIESYFPTKELRRVAMESLSQAAAAKEGGGVFATTVKVAGGGINAQAEAVRHGTARAISEWNAELRTPLKRAGFLKRDPRSKERKKFGLKKARRAAQWSKR